MAVFLNRAKNHAINGGLDNWTRGTSFAAIANAAYFADRFMYGKSGTMVHTASRNTDVPTYEQAKFNFQYSARLNLTTAQASLTTTQQCGFVQKIEGFMLSPLRNKYITIGLWVKATLPGIYPIAFRNGAQDRSYVTTVTISAANTWQQIVVTIKHEDEGTWDYTSGIGMWINFGIASGPSYNAPTLNTWLVGDYRSHASCVNGVAAGATDFYFTGLQIEEGQSLSNFDRAGGDYSEDQRLCMRYVQSVGFVKRRVSGTILFDSYQLPVPMRAFPVLASGSISDNGTLTISGTNPATAPISNINIQGSANATANGAHAITMLLDAEL
jgi:hypothetical protein